MSHIQTLELENWGPYRGVHRLELGPGVYALVGRYDRDGDRSNWSGKTWLLSAIRYALFGDLPDDCPTEDEWVTRGEQEGRVFVQLSDDTAIERRRRLGDSSKVRVLAAGMSEATGQHGREALAHYLAMSADDFRAGPWLGQRDIARMVLSRPAERAQLVDGWLNLTPLRAAERAAGERQRKEAEHARSCTELVAQRSVELAELGEEDEAALERFAKICDRLDQKIEHVRAKLAVIHTHAERAQAYEIAVRRRERREDDLAKAKLEYERATAEPIQDVDAARESEKLAHALNRDQERRVHELANLVHGEGFDGQCPVMCAECPAATVVSERVRELGEELHSARVTLNSTREKLKKASTHRDASSISEGRRAQAARDLEAARRALELEEPLPSEPQPAEDAHELNAELSRLKVQRDEAVTAIARAESDQARREKLRVAIEGEEKNRGYFEARAQTWGEAAAVLRGARREVSEGAVDDIEASACAALATAGLDLQVQFRWEREGSGLASHCERCGTAYPPKASAKLCAGCNHPRGQKLVEKLELVPSRRSGGADSLAGLMVQLAAGAWLRERKGSPLSIAVVDEPFAALDRANARALGQYLHRLVAGLGFEQAFVVAHDQAVTEAMPHAIVVRSDGIHSRLEVE